MLCHWCRLTSINSMSSITRSIFSTLYCSFEMIFTVVPSSGDFCWEPVCRTHTTHTFQGSLTLITDITFKNDLVKATDVLNGLAKKHGMPLKRGTHLLTRKSVLLWFYSAECKINSRWWEMLYTAIKHRKCTVHDRKINHCCTFCYKIFALLFRFSKGFKWKCKNLLLQSILISDHSCNPPVCLFSPPGSSTFLKYWVTNGKSLTWSIFLLLSLFENKREREREIKYQHYKLLFRRKPAKQNTFDIDTVQCHKLH